MIQPGDQPIPGYRVEELLGRGQFGQVWRARSPGNTQVALKFLDMDGRHGWKEFRAIQRVKQIRHAHLMPVVAIWLLDAQGQVLSDDAIDSIAASHEDDSQLAVPAMETLVAEPVEPTEKPARLIVANLLANQTLGDRLKECRKQGEPGIPAGELLRYMEEAAKGLDFLNSTQHTIGTSLGTVQHCDVKPDNIMLTGGSVVISDFGVAQMLAESRRDAKATSFGGTPAYMPPEMFQSKPCPTSDQYSLAVTYYELRTGELPFRERTYAAVYEAHKTGDLDFSELDPAEQQVLRKATSPDPTQRFESCAQFVAALREAIYPTASPRKAKQLAAVMVLGLLLAAGAAVAYESWKNGDDVDPLPIAPPELVDVPIEIIAPGAPLAVAINGDPFEVDSTGKGTYAASEGSSLRIEVNGGTEWVAKNQEYDLAELGADRTIRIDLDRSAAYFAAEADRLLSVGDERFDEAVDALARAIEMEHITYAQLPAPIVRQVDSAEIACLELAPDGRDLTVCTFDGAIYRWSIDATVGPRGDWMHKLSEKIVATAVSDRFIAVVPETAESVSLISRGAGRPAVIELPLPANEPPYSSAPMVKGIAFVDDGRRLVALTETFLFVGQPVKCALHVWNVARDDIAGSYSTLAIFEGEKEAHLGAAYSADWVVVSTMGKSSDEDVVRRCPLDDSDPVELYRQPGQLNSVAVTRDERLLAVGGGPAVTDDDLPNRATLIDNGNSAATLSLGHPGAIQSLAFDASGRHFATGGFEGLVQLRTIGANWSPADGDAGAHVVPLERRDPSKQRLANQPVQSLVCLPNGWVAALYEDGAAMLWNPEPSPATMLALPVGARTTQLAATPDGQWLITGDRKGNVRFWPAVKLMLLRAASDKAKKEPLPPDEVQSDPVACSAIPIHALLSTISATPSFSCG